MHQETLATAVSGTGSQLRVSEDGYIRLLPAAFKKTKLLHLVSGLDDEEAQFSAVGARVSLILGYTEWVSAGTPAITIGWDWQLGFTQDARGCRRLDEPRSNVMLLNDSNQDLGPVWTARMLGAAVDAMDWSEEVLRAVTSRYS